jgi:Snare region anchored in the vesicle membrane C-terminus
VVDWSGISEKLMKDATGQSCRLSHIPSRLIFFDRFIPFPSPPQTYHEHLSRIRGYLACTRTRTTLTQCQQALDAAKEAATAMQAMAEVEGNALRVREAQMLVSRDIGPLAAEVQRALKAATQQEELFYHAPPLDIESNFSSPSSDMDSLIRNSEDLLRESQTICADTEHMGNQTLFQLGRQREQLQNANRSLDGVLAATRQAKTILVNFSKRACRTRLGLYCSVAVLTAANILVIYCIIRKHYAAHHKSNGSDHDGGGDGPSFFWRK